jgi:lysophospholipase L1-like esterase
MKSFWVSLLGSIVFTAVGLTQALQQKLPASYFDGFRPLAAPVAKGLYVKKGDRLAICGDSITEQKMYSRIIETYLTVCAPDLGVSVRQYGWGGETAPGFLARMTNDCLLFSPTLATTCYGMNDHGYRPYEPSIGQKYRLNMDSIVESFRANGARVVLGSPGCVGKRPNWSRDTNATTEALNLNLCELRNIDIELAREDHVRFADVFWTMLEAGYQGQQKYGADYAIAGKDGVHPAWAGQTVMAYTFLKSMGLDGDIGTVTVDWKKRKAKASKGHEVVSFDDRMVQIESRRYPFCATNSDLSSDNTIRSAMSLVPFNRELNRFVLVLKRGDAKTYSITWGPTARRYSAAQLEAGVNLAEDFAVNPFWEQFNLVDQAVKAKQEYETKQVKQIFHGLLTGKYKSADEIKDDEMKQLFALRDGAGQLDRDQVIQATERKRQKLVDAIGAAFMPITHRIAIEPESK